MKLRMKEESENNLSEKGEVTALIDSVNDIIHRLIGDFVKYHSGKGHLEIRKESSHFILIMRLERKGG